MEPFVGQIQPFGFNFAPRGWAKCDGQILAISSNTALFSLLGTTFGGDGRTSFGLPDLRGRSIVHIGHGPGLSTIDWGERGGLEQIALNQLNLPSHSHALVNGTVNGSIETLDGGTAINETGASENKLASGGSQLEIFMESDGTASGLLDVNVSGTTSAAGSSQPFESRNPFLGINVCIAQLGIYPSRS
ncbi:phage tail protein [Polaribacter sp. L3A8]|uniref:phage tail protein n=1 Tax=Polaribacter sp. L3A8 TaxID=2686361 RepID=UPI00131D8C70|nr:tail fiber protein [Polaribacter sp. L3A8]